MQTSDLEELLINQRTTLQRWRNQSTRDAEDIAEDLIQRFHIRVASDLDGFVWDFADDFARMITGEWGDMYGRMMERHLQKTIGGLQATLEARIGSKTPNCTQSASDMWQRSLMMCVDKIVFKNALEKVKPGVLGILLSPAMHDDRWEAWSAEQNQKILESLDRALQTLKPKITQAVGKCIDDACDEYEQGLSALDHRLLADA